MYSTLQWKAHSESLLMTPTTAYYALRTQKHDHVTTSTSCSLFFCSPLNYVVWHNFLGCFTPQHKQL